jgi:hypothetical protein
VAVPAQARVVVVKGEMMDTRCDLSWFLLRKRRKLVRRCAGSGTGR